ncbi:hypothetical protein F5Y14DRAFT_426752 [Nemania sp. NC0429]|nr:hypothetical protein F5Y14DRAFT_426752 [Nemania sp. NC0429]
MESQPRGMGAVPNELILRIVENMDTSTRERFMMTDKRVYTLTKTYEHSISKGRAALFTLPPLGDVLSSSATERHIIPKNTFSMICELELRDERIDQLLAECPNTFCIHSPPWLPCLTVAQQNRLVAITKRALYQCDRIADIAANESVSSIPPELDDDGVSGMLAHPAALAYPPIGDVSRLNPLAKPGARPKQIKYIQSLPLEDIAGIFATITMLGTGLMCACMCSSTARNERITVIEECVLRHGTWFVWSRLLGSPELQDLAGSIIVAGWAELRGWESGAISSPPGLKMMLMQRFKEQLGGKELSVEEFSDKIRETLEKLVCGDDKKPADSESGSKDK